MGHKILRLIFGFICICWNHFECVYINSLSRLYRLTISLTYVTFHWFTKPVQWNLDFYSLIFIVLLILGRGTGRILEGSQNSSPRGEHPTLLPLFFLIHFCFSWKKQLTTEKIRLLKATSVVHSAMMKTGKLPSLFHQHGINSQCLSNQPWGLQKKLYIRLEM